MTLEQMREELGRIKAGEHGAGAAVKSYAGAILAAAGFTMFFGGTLFDALFTIAGAAAVCGFIRRAGRYFPNVFLGNFVIAFISGVILYGFGLLVPALHADKSIIGVIMLLIPGIAITNAVRDIIIGDIISGALKILESVFSTLAMAIGYIAAMLITGGAL